MAWTTSRVLLIVSVLVVALGYAVVKTQRGIVEDKKRDGYNSPAFSGAPVAATEGFVSTISMKNTTNTDLALIDYVVKASANSALEPSLKAVSLAQLRKVVKRGCRWLDFEVFAADHLPVVGFAPSAGAMTSTATTLPLITVLEEAYRSAFSTTGSPNAGDPLFVNLRVRTDDATAVYPVIQSSVSNAFGSVLLSKRIDPATTPLSELMGRVVLSLDVLYSAPELAVVCDNSYRSCAAAQSLRSIAGILAGSSTVPMTTFSIQKNQPPVPVMPDDPHTVEAERLRKMQFNACTSKGPACKAAINASIPMKATTATTTTTNANTAKTSGPPIRENGVQRNTTATRFRCTVPDVAPPAANPNFLAFIRGHGTQVTAMQFYKDDTNLASYETFFNDNGQSAFVPLSTAIRAATTSVK